MIAASGIDNTVKVYSPDRKAQEDARRGVNILDPEHISETNGHGLKSCKRMHESYQIMSQNDVDRQGGMSDAFVTVSLPLSSPELFSGNVHVLMYAEEYVGAHRDDAEKPASPR